MNEYTLKPISTYTLQVSSMFMDVYGFITLVKSLYVVLEVHEAKNTYFASLRN